MDHQSKIKHSIGKQRVNGTCEIEALPWAPMSSSETTGLDWAVQASGDAGDGTNTHIKKKRAYYALVCAIDGNG